MSPKLGTDSGAGLDEGDTGGDNETDHQGSKVTDSDNPQQKGAGDNAEKSYVELQNIRAVVQNVKSRKVFFTPNKSGLIQLMALQVGADNDYEIAIHDTSDGLLKSGGVVLEAIKGQRMMIEIGLNQEYLGALKVVAYEV